MTGDEVLREPPLAGDETATLLGSLERQRATLAWTCHGLDAAGMRAAVGVSTMTLGGLLKHLALVEDEYSARRLRGRSLGAPRDTADGDADPEGEWRSAADDSPEQLRELRSAAVSRSGAAVRHALAAGGLDRATGLAWPDGRAPSLRRTLIDLVAEHARPVGRADLLRESVDGLTREGPPR